MKHRLLAEDIPTLVAGLCRARSRNAISLSYEVKETGLNDMHMCSFTHRRACWCENFHNPLERHHAPLGRSYGVYRLAAFSGGCVEELRPSLKRTSVFRLYKRGEYGRLPE